MTVKIVKELPVSNTGAKQCLVQKGKKYFVVSSVNAFGTGFETLVFPGNEKGHVTSWDEVAGGRGVSRKDAIKDLEASNA